MASWEWFLFGYVLAIIMSGVTWKVIFWFIKQKEAI